MTDTTPEIPPNDPKLERAILGAMMMNPSTVDRVFPIISDDAAFYDQRHRKLYRLIVEMRNAGKPVDLPHVVQEVTNTRAIEPADAQWIAGIESEGVARSNHAPHDAKELDLLLRRRELIKGLERGTKAARDLATPFSEGLTIADRAIYGTSGNTTPEVFDLAECVNDEFDQIEERARRGGHLVGVSSCYPELDRITEGFLPGEFVLIAARPSVGKTAFVLNILRRVALEQRLHVTMFSLEMNRASITRRLISAASEIPESMLKTGEVLTEPTGRYTAALSKASGDLADAPVSIIPAAGVTCAQIRALSRRLVREKHTQLIIVDYLGLIRPDTRAENRTQEVAAISHALKALAAETDIPVLVCSQLNRATETRSDPTPQLSDLRDSGDLEQDADKVLFLHRREMYAKTDADREKVRGCVDVIIAKNRQGKTGTVQMTFRPEFQRFETL